jgi:hypothetical protein
MPMAVRVEAAAAAATAAFLRCSAARTLSGTHGSPAALRLRASLRGMDTGGATRISPSRRRRVTACGACDRPLSSKTSTT